MSPSTSGTETVNPEAVNLWSNADHATDYLARRSFPWRDTAYEQLMESVPAAPRRALDLGCGDGLVAGRVTVVEHDLDEPLPADWGRFAAVVSAFAIHHVVDERKRTLYAEAQGEAVAFLADSSGYVTVSEGAHPRLHFFGL